MGSFTYVAAVRFAQKQAQSTDLEAKNTLRDIFQSVSDGIQNDEVQGVVAIENNVEGFVGETLDLLLEFDDIKICDMLWLDIAFDAVKLKADTSELAVIRAHSHALAQCKDYITQNDFKMLPSLSNSAAAMELKNGEVAFLPHNTELSGNFAHLEVLQVNVQDFEDAKTQFILLKKCLEKCVEECSEKHLEKVLPENTENEQANHTIWALIPEFDHPGMLLEILTIIRKYNINISTLISRPVKGVKQFYTFFLTLDESLANCKSAILEIEKLSVKSHFLGGYYAK